MPIVMESMRPLRHPVDLDDPALDTAVAGGRPVTVAVVARRAATRSALVGLLASEPSLDAVGAASDEISAVRLLRSRAPEVLVLDLRTLGQAGFRRLPTLMAAAPRTAVVVIGMGEHPGFAARATAAGAAGYVRLDEAAERLASAVRAAASAR